MKSYYNSMILYSSNRVKRGILQVTKPVLAAHFLSCKTTYFLFVPQFLEIQQLCVWVFNLNVCLCIMCVQCPQKPEDVRSPRTGTTDSFILRTGTTDSFNSAEVLRITPGSSGRILSVHNYWIISAAPKIMFSR